MKKLLIEAVNERSYHKARGKNGRIEALCASIRIRAILDCMIHEKQIDSVTANRIYMKKIPVEKI
jgi:hypothetical protein